MEEPQIENAHSPVHQVHQLPVGQQVVLGRREEVAINNKVNQG
jgi:hypothetical protein